MRIAQVAPLAEAVPPKLYGGTERVVSWLTVNSNPSFHNVSICEFRTLLSLARDFFANDCTAAHGTG